MNPQHSDSEAASPAVTSGPSVSAGRKRTGVVLLAVVGVVFGIVLWQTWDYWHPTDEMADAGESGGEAAPGARGGMPPGPPPGMFNPQEARRRLHEQVKASMEATDEQWATLGPKVEAVTRLQDQLRQGRGVFPPPSRIGAPAENGGDAGGPDARQPAGRAAAKTAAEEVAETDAMLRASVDDQQTPEAAVVSNLKASRAARAKLESELKSARDALRQGLTLRQEAALVGAGILD
jgi:hypothetical protein